MKHAILFLLFLSTVFNRSTAGAVTPFLVNDTIVISKPITDEIAGSAYRKRATQYQFVHQADTSGFSIIFIESNKNDFDHEGTVYAELIFDRNKSIREQKEELAFLLNKASEEYEFDSLKSIFSLWLPNLGDLNIRASRELEMDKDKKLILKDFWKLNDFLLKSSLAKEMNEWFKKYNLTVKQFSIEHFNFSSKPETLRLDSKIETKPDYFPKSIMEGEMWVFFN